MTEKVRFYRPAAARRAALLFGAAAVLLSCRNDEPSEIPPPHR